MPAHQNSWLFTPAELRHTPSILSGMPPREERERRAKGIHFILQVGIALKVPQLTISTAAVFLHRFYMRQKMQVHHHYEIAATSLFLATKVEENMKKYDHLITEVIRVAQKNPKMPPVDRHSGDFWRWSDVIQEKEELMLEALCFDLHVPKSYDFLLAFTKTLDVETKEVLRSAWSFLNDSYMSLVCLVYRAEAIAAGALDLALERRGQALPAGWEEKCGVTPAEVRGAKKWIVAIYENNQFRPPGPEDIPPSPPSSPRPHDDSQNPSAAASTNASVVGTPQKRPHSDDGNESDAQKRPRLNGVTNGEHNGNGNGTNGVTPDSREREERRDDRREDRERDTRDDRDRHEERRDERRDDRDQRDRYDDRRDNRDRHDDRQDRRDRSPDRRDRSPERRDDRDRQDHRDRSPERRDDRQDRRDRSPDHRDRSPSHRDDRRDSRDARDRHDDRQDRHDYKDRSPARPHDTLDRDRHERPVIIDRNPSTTSAPARDEDDKEEGELKEDSHSEGELSEGEVA